MENFHLAHVVVDVGTRVSVVDGHAFAEHETHAVLSGRRRRRPRITDHPVDVAHVDVVRAPAQRAKRRGARRPKLARV